jgi:hypothetical protein
VQKCMAGVPWDRSTPRRFAWRHRALLCCHSGGPPLAHAASAPPLPPECPLLLPARQQGGAFCPTLSRCGVRQLPWQLVSHYTTPQLAALCTPQHNTQHTPHAGAATHCVPR